MELRHIRYFLALAEELNFSRAAEKLHISQPPLSRQIQELEEEIGTRLFHRTKRHVELTEAGKVFKYRAYQILDQVEQAAISSRLTSSGKEGEFRIGFNGNIQDIIPTLKKYRLRFPNVGIIMQHLTNAEQMEALREQRIDIGLTSIPSYNKKIEVYPLQKVPFLAAIPEEHPLASKPAIYLQDLADESFITTTKAAGSLYYEMIMTIFKQAKFTPKLTIQAHDLHSIMALVAGGLGISLLPSLTNYSHGVIRRKIEDVDLDIQPYLAWNKDNRSVILKNFLNFFVEIYEGNDPPMNEK